MKKIPIRGEKKVSSFAINREDSEYERGLEKGQTGLGLGFYSQKILIPLPSDTARLSTLKA